MLDVSDDLKRRISQALAHADDGTVCLDPASPEDRALIADLLAASGKGPDRYPALHAAVARPNGAPADPGEIDANVVDLGADRSGNATSRTWVASRGGAYISGATTLVMDADAGATLASGTATQVGSTLVQVATRSADAAPAAARQRVVTFVHSQKRHDTPPLFALVAATRRTPKRGLDVTIEAPVHINSTGTAIVIGEGRSEFDLLRNKDADYTYPAGRSVYPSRLVVPFTGQAELPYRTAVDARNPIGVTTRLYVTSAQAWTKPVSTFDLQTPLSASGFTVQWNYPYDREPIEVTGSIQYAQLANLSDPTASFFYQFAVPVDRFADPTYIFTVCSEDNPDAPSDNCTLIPPLQYWWHCVAEGTRVTLADGTEAPIESLDNTMSVRSGGGAATVIATSRAPHHDNAGHDPALRLRTAGGHELVLTSGHAVVTPGGVVPARDLAPGDPVLTADGTQAVASVEPVPLEGLVWNLRVEPAEGRAFGSYLANGIEVGDHLAQAAQFHARRHDPARVLATLPASHHQDWRSALADAAAR